MLAVAIMVLRTITTQPPSAATTSSDFVFSGQSEAAQVYEDPGQDHAADPVHRTTVRVDRRVVRSDTNKDNNTSHQGSVIRLRRIMGTVSESPKRSSSRRIGFSGGVGYARDPQW
ncbi:hypothetical protein Acr_20g0002970 [Actinidia rufa]|uniref:Uncharacterized protein n=1 Tax=Actinidia rufa TaxID=165716 RepID=A0A7J0GCH1_9ERIC|nr:hypothetical protein Acr_20g0002970 [Actinidia rufa]